ncbi:MAG: hypothetical protein F4086_17675 [Gemmatimonadetes bacterium]|nr:hypothetical protein [Dehalococcoidia bacterium]MYJ12136.1 hypothetical protein [Gemmatimonadota bacterium]
MTDTLTTTTAGHLPEEFCDLLREAVARLSEATTAGPARLDALVRRAVIHRMLGEFDEAILDHDRAVARYPLDPIVRCARGITLLQAGRTTAAARDFDKAAELDVWDVETHYQQIASHMALGQWIEAAEALDAFIHPRDKDLERRLREWETGRPTGSEEA